MIIVAVNIHRRWKVWTFGGSNALILMMFRSFKRMFFPVIRSILTCSARKIVTLFSILYIQLKGQYDTWPVIRGRIDKLLPGQFIWYRWRWETWRFPRRPSVANHETFASLGTGSLRQILIPGKRTPWFTIRNELIINPFHYLANQATGESQPSASDLSMFL